MDDSKQYLKVTFEAIKPNLENILILLKDNMSLVKKESVVEWQVMPIFINQLDLIISRKIDSQKLVHFINHLIEFNEESEHLKKFTLKKCDYFFSSFNCLSEDEVLKTFLIIFDGYIETLIYCFEDQWTNSATVAWKGLFDFICVQYSEFNFNRNSPENMSNVPDETNLISMNNKESNLDHLFKEQVPDHSFKQATDLVTSQVSNIEDAALEKKMKKMFEHYLETEGAELMERIVKKVISA